MKILSNLVQQKLEERRANMYRSLLHYAAKMGGQLFGAIPQGTRREFFCLDEHSWVWHEEWTDAQGRRQVVTTRYDIRPNGVLKSQGGNSYQRLDIREARNLYKAVLLYEQRMDIEVQRLRLAA
jgi:hypothetical protein